MVEDSQNRFTLWQKEKVLLDELKQLRPMLFDCEKKCSTSILKEIGIDMTSTPKPKGYIKHLPFDFIVEEIQTDGTIITIDKTHSPVDATSEDTITVYADLVKIGISSIEAVDQLSKALDANKSQITYAGIKDTVAITAQKISFRHLPLKKIINLDVPQLFLKNFSTGKGVVTVGALKGNRFTILIRTFSDFDIETIEYKIQHINKVGLYNYYGPQRFGSPRYISHILGKCLLQGDFEKLVRTVLTTTSKFEWLFISQLRVKADKVFGNWEEMKKFYAHLPQVFISELKLLERLQKWNGTGDQWIWAIGFDTEQIDFWAKSYASFLANKVLHRAEKGEIELSEKIPLLLNTVETEKINELYGKYLKQDGTEQFRQHLKKVSHVRMGANSYLETKIRPLILKTKKIPEGFAITFDLPKGAYATTLLYELFDIVEGEEERENIKKSYVNTKKELSVGSFDSIKEWAEQYIEKYSEK